MGTVTKTSETVARGSRDKAKRKLFANFDPNRVPTPLELAEQAERRKAFAELRAFEDELGWNEE